MTWHNPPMRGAVVAALKKHGPMTCHAIADTMDWTLEQVQNTLRNTRRLQPGKVFRVTGYLRAAEGKGKDASIYAAEAGKDQPRMTKVAQRLKTNQARYRKRHSALINARLRTARALQAGHTVQINPWAQLAPKNMRSAMSIKRSDNKKEPA